MPLHVLTASQLQTPEAALAFLAGPDFGALLRAAGYAACPAGDVAARTGYSPTEQKRIERHVEAGAQEVLG